MVEWQFVMLRKNKLQCCEIFSMNWPTILHVWLDLNAFEKPNFIPLLCKISCLGHFPSILRYPIECTPYKLNFPRKKNISNCEIYDRELMMQVSNTDWFDLHCIKILMATQLTATHQTGKYCFWLVQLWPCHHVKILAATQPTVTRDLLACSIIRQPTTLLHAPSIPVV
jgi:hypothetical protein